MQCTSAFSCYCVKKHCVSHILRDSVIFFFFQLQSCELQHVIVAHRNKQALAKSCIRKQIFQRLCLQTGLRRHTFLQLGREQSMRWLQRHQQCAKTFNRFYRQILLCILTAVLSNDYGHALIIFNWIFCLMEKSWAAGWLISLSFRLKVTGYSECQSAHHDVVLQWFLVWEPVRIWYFCINMDETIRFLQKSEPN